MSKINEQMLKAIMPHTPKVKRLAALPILNKVAFDYQINNEKRISAWIATLAIESGELKYQEEIASGAAYDTRTDLGNTAARDGDGQLYKGRGRIQITGKTNYRKYTEYLQESGHLPFTDFVKNPKKLAQEPYATDSAGWFFAVYIKANPLADSGQFLEIQLRVNGGRKRVPPRPNHWVERKDYYARSLRVIPDDFILDVIEEVKIDNATLALVESTEGYPDFEINEDTYRPVISEFNKIPIGESADPSVEPIGTVTSEEFGPPSSSDSSNLSLKIDGDKVDLKTNSLDSSSDPKERIAVVKPKPQAFINTILSKITAAVTGNALVLWLTEKASLIQELNLSKNFWYSIVGIVALGSIVWIIYEISEHRRSKKREAEITDMLVKENSTPENLAQLIEADMTDVYKLRGFKIITR